MKHKGEYLPYSVVVEYFLLLVKVVGLISVLQVIVCISCLSVIICSIDNVSEDISLHTHAHTSCFAEKALSEARESLEEIRQEMEAWRAQHEATHRRLKTERAANSTMKVSTVTSLPRSHVACKGCMC